jgi:hypothetical protein
MLTGRQSTSRRRLGSPRRCPYCSTLRPPRRVGSTCGRARTASTARTARVFTSLAKSGRRDRWCLGRTPSSQQRCRSPRPRAPQHPQRRRRRRRRNRHRHRRVQRSYPLPKEPTIVAVTAETTAAAAAAAAHQTPAPRRPTIRLLHRVAGAEKNWAAAAAAAEKSWMPKAVKSRVASVRR